ncbi:ankyrin repeat domain-containing protein [Spiroplasma endosymbiont of Nebria brevicollis]|uniref:ankyrin repeat domain-containing protein n=1 Tax=Spiroplasma endosymbiont of Nebria brevicollis TaxID=3066284 RepID=UPI00313DAB94
MLCEAGAEIETTQDMIIENEIDKLPLICAIEVNNPEIIDYLLTKELHTNLETFVGDTALAAALEKDNFSLFKKLISDYNTNFNDINDYNFENLIKSCNLEALDFVLDNVEDFDLNRLVDDNSTPILTQILIHNGFSEELDQAVHIKMIEKLVKNSYDINAKDSDGNTALHYAVNSEYDDLAQYAEPLLRLEANKSIANSEGKTFFDLAKTNPNPLIKELLNNNQELGQKLEESREEKEKNLTGEFVEPQQYQNMPSTSSEYIMMAYDVLMKLSD